MAWADFVEPDLVGEVEYVSTRSAMGARTLEVVVPEDLSSAIQARFDATAVPLERGDPWLAKDLGGSP